MDDPGYPDDLSVDAMRRLEEVCTKFEQAECADDRDISRLLEGFLPSERPYALCELAAIDIEQRSKSGKAPPLSEYLDLTKDIDERRKVQARLESIVFATETSPSLPASDRYEFKDRIGSGGISIIWQVHDVRGDRPLAIKLLQPRYRLDQMAKERLHREALLTGSLQHPGIPPVYDHGSLANGDTFFAMKLVQGETLESQLKSRADNESELPHLLSIFEQVAQTLGYAHSQGIVHRDLKPQNIMVGRFGEVQVMDWGMAKRLGSPPTSGEPKLNSASTAELGAGSDSTIHSLSDPHETVTTGGSLPEDGGHSLTAAGDVLGTPCYMPPEQARGEIDSLDQRSDVFGLGSILFEILTGERLYSGGSAGEVLAKAAACDLDLPLARLRQTGDDDLRQLCERCISPRREDRPSDAGVISREISDYLASVQERLRHAEIDRREAVVRASEESKRRRSMSWMAIAIATISILGSAGIFWQWRTAIAANEKANNALQLADERFQQAQGIVNDYLTEVASSDGILDRTPGTQSLRRALLEKARDYYEQFLAEAGDDRTIRYEAAQAYARLGEIAQILDPAGDETFAMYAKAVEQYQLLIDDDGDRKEYAAGLAKAHAALGNAHFDTNHYKDAIGEYSRATEIWTDLTLTDADPDFALGLAKSVHNIGHSMSKSGDQKGAKPFLEQALDLSQPLLESHGDDTEFLFQISNIHSNAGTFFGFKLRDWDRSLELYEKSLELRQRMVELEPDKHRHVNAVAGILNNRALALYQHKRFDEARDDFIRSAELKEELVRDYPSIAQYARELGNSYTNLGTFSVKRGDPIAGSTYYQKSADVFLDLASSHPQVIFHWTAAIDALASLVQVQPFTPKSDAALRTIADCYSNLLIQRPGHKNYIKNQVLFSALGGELPSKTLVEISEPLALGETENPDHLAVRALALYRDGKNDQALLCLQAIDPEHDAETTKLVAALVLAVDDNPKAREYFQQALKTKKQSGYASVVNQRMAPEIRKRLREMEARLASDQDP